jgi:hypothetical protein
MAAAYNYSSIAGEMALTGAVNPSATAITLNAVTGLPAVPFKVVLDPGQLTEEVVKVTAISGLNLTVIRGWDSTAATDHASFAKVHHMATAEDHRLSRVHEDATVVHGVTSAVAGTTDVQVLSNKTFQSPTATTVTVVSKAISAQTADLAQWQDGTGVVLGKVDVNGNATFPNLTTLTTLVNTINAGLPATATHLTTLDTTTATHTTNIATNTAAIATTNTNLATTNTTLAATRPGFVNDPTYGWIPTMVVGAANVTVGAGGGSITVPFGRSVPGSEKYTWFVQNGDYNANSSLNVYGSRPLATGTQTGILVAYSGATAGGARINWSGLYTG